MLQIEKLSFRYGTHSPLVLDGVSLSLPPGRIGVLLGPNGAGKSTLFRIILGLLRPESGSLLLEGENLLRLSGRERARRIAWVPQSVHFGALSVYDSILMGRIAYFGFRAGEKDRAVTRKILRELGMEDLAERNAETLSGGEKQKLAIARAMAQEPQLLIMDEPTGNLDPANEEQILTMAAGLAKEKNIAVLVSLHDLNQALDYGDCFYLMKKGQIRYTGGTEMLRPDVIREIYGVDTVLAEWEGRKFIVGGRKK